MDTLNIGLVPFCKLWHFEFLVEIWNCSKCKSFLGLNQMLTKDFNTSYQQTLRLKNKYSADLYWEIRMSMLPYRLRTRPHSPPFSSHQPNSYMLQSPRLTHCMAMCTCVASHQDWNVQMQATTGLNAKSHRRHADQRVMLFQFLGQTIYKMIKKSLWWLFCHHWITFL